MIITTSTPRQDSHFAPWAIADTLGSGNIPSAVKSFSPTSGFAQSYNQTINSELLLEGTKTFGDFNTKLIVGGQVIANDARLMSMSANALVIPDFYNISNRLGQPTVGQSLIQQRVIGAFGDLTVGYKNFLYSARHPCVMTGTRFLTPTTVLTFIRPLICHRFYRWNRFPSEQ